MTNYILKRLGQGLLTVFLTVSTVFILIRLAPGDPAVSYAGPLATTEQLAKVREQFGLDRPVLEQYWIFLQQLFTGNLGTLLLLPGPGHAGGGRTDAVHAHPGHRVHPAHRRRGHPAGRLDVPPRRTPAANSASTS